MITIDDILTEKSKSIIILRAINSPTKEVCGIVVKHGSEQTIINSRNMADDPTKKSQISANAQMKAYELGTFEAIYHTHAELGEPYLSELDIQQSKLLGLPYLLYHEPSDTWDYFNPAIIENPYPLTISGNPKTINYYLGWRWFWDRSDCWSIVRAYYYGMLNIELEDYSRPSAREIFRTGWSAFDENLESRGFKKFYGTPLKNDLILMNIEGKNPHHIGVMVNNKDFLHLYDEKRPSEIINYAGSWIESTHSLWRYQF